MPHVNLLSPVGRVMATRDSVAPEPSASRGCAKPPGHATGRSEAACPCCVHAFVHLPRSPLRRHGVPDVRTDRSAARIRAAVTSVRRCGVVDGPQWAERSPHRCMDRRASQSNPATECTNRRVRAPSVIPGAFERNVQPPRATPAASPVRADSISRRAPSTCDGQCILRGRGPSPAHDLPRTFHRRPGRYRAEHSSRPRPRAGTRPCGSGHHGSIEVHPGRARAAMTQLCDLSRRSAL